MNQQRSYRLSDLSKVKYTPLNCMLPVHPPFESELCPWIVNIISKGSTGKINIDPLSNSWFFLNIQWRIAKQRRSARASELSKIKYATLNFVGPVQLLF